MRTVCIVFLLLWSQLGMLQAQANLTFQSANEAYEQSDYKSAIQQYEAILAKGTHSEALYYNLANSYYKQNKLGKAILNYERALLLDRSDENSLHNLEIARRKVQGEIDPVPPFFLRSWWNSWRGSLSSTSWGIIALLFFWAGITGLSIWQIGKTKEDKKKGFLIGVLFLVFSIFPFSLAWSAMKYQQNTNEGILVLKTAALKAGADESSKELRSIYEGTKLELLDQINIWYKVRLENGETGWLSKDSFEVI